MQPARAQARGGLALVVIDMQAALVEGAYLADDMLARHVALIAKARAAQVPVVYVQHDHATWAELKRGTPGWKIHPDIAPASGDAIVEKTASDAFYETPLRSILAEKGVGTLAVTGMQTECCVDTTARSALSQGFDVMLVGDCHSTSDSDMSAAQIIAHHNALLPNVVHPTHRIRLSSSDTIRF
ncbi:hypothetical protein ASG87_01035 [Frateuria sp. Soil773]|nr:hypothetical protein ASG87_01035 [Frateuria sp. Soil773]